MPTRKNFVFIALHIIAWIIFVALCIEAGGLIVNFIFSIYRPEFIHNLYQKLDLIPLYNRSRWAFFTIYSFILGISVLKAYLFYLVIMLLSKLNLSMPFNSFVSNQITKISYYTFSIGLLSYIAKYSAQNIGHRSYDVDLLSQFWADSEAFILMSAVVYIIAAIFAKGVELQKENDLTV